MAQARSEVQLAQASQLRESVFHDEWADSIEPSTVLVNETFTACTSPESRWLLAQLGDVSGKRLLDLGSGAGESAVFFALQGAEVTATDVSEGMLAVAAKVAERHGVALNCRIASAEDLSEFDDGSFDVVFGANVLHHVDIEGCLEEVKRVLKPGGKAAFWDPLAYNPAINFYRRMATAVRTTDEHPLKREHLKSMRTRFSDVRVKFFWLSTLALFLKFYFVDRVHPNDDRYWKRVVARESELKGIYKPLERLDSALLKVFPFLGWMAWTCAVILKK
jgi:2-polyprenyl-3-methyl-5-hydroxy-6-metoxy-1,4-benzoquinol methylase